MAPQRRGWKARNRYYYLRQEAYFRFLIPEGKRVLEIGCGTGELLAALRPAMGVGIDISSEMVRLAGEAHPNLRFIHTDGETSSDWGLSETFDFIVISDTIGLLEDVQSTLEGLQPFCKSQTRVIISYYNFMWEPILNLAEKLGKKMPQGHQNWLSPLDIENILDLTGFETVKKDARLLFPKRVKFISPVMEFLAIFPGLNKLCLCNYLVARTRSINSANKVRSVSTVIPCRNEKGNIEAAVQRLDRAGFDTEIIFVDGHSTDGTQDEIQRLIQAYPDKEIQFLIQDGTGKGDAVRKGFAHAKGDILMILDADLTMPPEDLPKFYDAIASGKGEFINGCRLVYPMEKQAMRFLNMLGNKFFSLAFSWLLNQRIKDTLCGTKVLSRENYEQIAENRSYFGEFDPFGDFDLLFGAAKLNLKLVEVPIRYRERTYGSTNISRFRHGLVLLRMCIFAVRKLKLI